MSKASFVNACIFLLCTSSLFSMHLKRLESFTKKKDPQAPRAIRYNSHANKWFSDWWLRHSHPKEDLLYHMIVPLDCDKFILTQGVVRQQKSNLYGIDEQFSLLARVERINMKTGVKTVEYRDCHLTFNESKVCYHRGAKVITKQEFFERLSQYDNPEKRASYVQLLNAHHIPFYEWVIQRNGVTRQEYPFNITVADTPYAQKVNTGSLHQEFHFSDGSSETIKIDFFSPLKKCGLSVSDH